MTSAGHAQSYVVSTLAPEGAGPTDSTLYLLAAETPHGCGGLGRFRTAGERFSADRARGLRGTVRLSVDRRRRGLSRHAERGAPVVLPRERSGGPGIEPRGVAGMGSHPKSAKFERLGQTLGEAVSLVADDSDQIAGPAAAQHSDQRRQKAGG